MKNVLLVQLPIPQINYGRQTGNIPLGAACLKQAAAALPDVQVDILPESVAAYMGDAALVRLIVSRKPDIVGFTVYNWNVERSLHIAACLKQAFGPRIIFGGPEVTPDNTLVRSDHVDFYVYGEGEAVFLRLLASDDDWQSKTAACPAEKIFKSSPSPYLSGLLEPGIENMMLLETQRGCPYRCGYCYYNKSRIRPAFAEEDLLLKGIQWAVDHRIRQLYLLDPSLNARPGLTKTLKKFAAINRQHPVGIISEIRAEAIDAELADLFAAAGFIWFEIGLQSTNPKALDIMNRPTDLQRFVTGATLLKERDMLPQIDLIAGLPGDDLQGFMASADFVAAHDLAGDAQVFPLAVLPGTDFRRRSRQLGLCHEPLPPYNVIRTPTFSADDLLLALDHAEVRFDMSLFPLPDLDLAYRAGTGQLSNRNGDQLVRLGDHTCVSRVNLNTRRPLSELERIAAHLAHPYQLLVGPPAFDAAYLCRVLAILTAANPFIPLELVFFEPPALPDTGRLLSAVKLKRPHFLDIEQRFLFSAPGNRAVLFTVVSRDNRPIFRGDMQRQVAWWRRERLPSAADLARLDDLEGILIDSPADETALTAWQDTFADRAEDLQPISFADTRIQKRWMRLTAADEYRIADE